MRTPDEVWARHYDAERRSRGDLAWPSETLVRLIKGDYIPGFPKSSAGMSAIDVGFGNCNNTIVLGEAGFAVSGVEVHEDICRAGRDRMAKFGFDVDFRVGTNCKLPFPDRQFDLLVSWNVLHYEGTEENVCTALSEYARVLKSNGRLIVSTTGPEHKILHNAETVGSHQYRIGRDDDFRSGTVHFLFDAENYLRFYFERHFSDVMVGRTLDRLFTSTLDWWIVTGKRRD